MARIAALAFALAALAALPAAGQKACSKAEESVAMKAVDRVASWSSLHSTWKAYRHCDKGEVADLFTEALLRLIVDWKQVEQLAEAMKDREYEDFVLSHLRSPAAKNDAEDVYSRAKMSCPKGLATWCSGIAAAADQSPPKPIAVEPIAPPAPSPEKK